MKKKRIDELQKKYGTGKYKKKNIESKIKIEEAELKLKRKTKKENKSFKQKLNTPFLRLYAVFFFLILTIILICIFKKTDVNSYIPKLILDHKEVKTKASVYIKNKGEILTNSENRNDATVYMTITDMKNILDKNLLYNEKEKEIVLTGKAALIQILLDTNEININGVKKKLESDIFKEEIYTYIPVNEIVKALGYNLIISEEFNIILDSNEKKLKTLSLKENTNLKKNPGIFAKNIMALNKDDAYIVVEELPKNIKIRTKGGIYGYVNKRKVQNIVVVNKENKEKIKENYNYILNYTNPGDNPDFINKDKNKKNAAIADMFKVDFENEKGFVVKDKYDLSSESYNKYKNKILVKEEMDLFAKITVSKEAADNLEKFEYRIDLIKKISEKLKNNNLNKVLFVFEDIKDPAAISRFIIEAKAMLSSEGEKEIALPNEESLKAEILQPTVDYYIDL